MNERHKRRDTQMDYIRWRAHRFPRPRRSGTKVSNRAVRGASGPQCLSASGYLHGAVKHGQRIVCLFICKVPESTSVSIACDSSMPRSNASAPVSLIPHSSKLLVLTAVRVSEVERYARARLITFSREVREIAAPSAAAPSSPIVFPDKEITQPQPMHELICDKRRVKRWER